MFEETTLQDLSSPIFLGRHTFGMREYEMNEEQDAWFYQLHATQPTEDSWLHEARYGSAEPLVSPIPFRFYWAKLPYKGTPLIAHHGKYLNELRVSGQ